MWSGGLIDSLLAFSVYICHFGRHGDACWRGGNCECCRLADASFGASVEFGRFRLGSILEIVHYKSGEGISCLRLANNFFRCKNTF